MAGFHRFSASHQLMVDRLVDGAFVAVFWQADARKGRVQQHVDLVKGQPMLNLVLAALKDSARVAFEKDDSLAATPTTVFLC